MKKKTYEERAVQFAMSEPIDRVRSVLETMKAILSERTPKVARERKPRTPKPEPVPETAKAAKGDV